MSRVMAIAINLAYLSLFLSPTVNFSTYGQMMVMASDASTAAFSSPWSSSALLTRSIHHSSPRPIVTLLPQSSCKRHEKNRRQKRLPFFTTALPKLHQTKDGDTTTKTTTLTSTISLVESVNLPVPSHEYAKHFYGTILGCHLSPDENDNDGTTRMYCTPLSSTTKPSYFKLTHGRNDENSTGKQTPSSELMLHPSSISIGLHYDNLEGLKHRLKENNKDSIIADCEIGIDERTQREYLRLVDAYTNTVFYARTTTPTTTTSKNDNSKNDHDNVASACLGINYIEFTTRPNLSSMISQFYEGIFDVPTTIVQNEKMENIVIVPCGSIDVDTGLCSQNLLFRECSEQTLSPQDTLQTEMSISLSCSGNAAGDVERDDEEGYKSEYSRVLEHCEMANIVSMQKAITGGKMQQQQQQQQQQQDQRFGFEDIVDLRTGRTILKLQHEIHSDE